MGNLTPRFIINNSPDAYCLRGFCHKHYFQSLNIFASIIQGQRCNSGEWRVDLGKYKQYPTHKLRLILAGVTLLACLIVSVPLYTSAAAINSLPDMPEDKLITAHEKARGAPAQAHPQYLFALAEEVLHITDKFDAENIKLIEAALKKDPEDAFAWANYSYLKTRISGQLDNQAAEALRTSIRLCRLCDRTLIKWRLEYVLASWNDVPEDIRLAVFEGADVLRWWHLDYEYLRTLRLKAEAANIPFLTYQRRVGTKIRPQEIGLRADSEQ